MILHDILMSQDNLVLGGGKISRVGGDILGHISPWEEAIRGDIL